jgi:hypothetical protein
MNLTTDNARLTQKEFMQQYADAQAKAVEYVKTVGGPEFYAALYNATLIQRLFPIEAARQTIEHFEAPQGYFARACLLVCEKIWSDRPIGAAVGGLVNNLNSDFTLNN